ncbi:hypothetical protein J2T56_000694 [Natronobacillus azotifigens]|uniref:Uncharacterized protein n=1 Tax=Natronobacillus azotifigens TaxID=472978 RepID=A0A9J6R9P3_9BACI|nr:hypothetical protein [Natronobacillus azotifigens]MCZ0702271.1 hypothetical protein [Natronobacillus azotifigens]
MAKQLSLNQSKQSRLHLFILIKDVLDGFKIISKRKLLFILIIISALLNFSIIDPHQIGLPYIAKQLPGGALIILGS